MTPSRDDQLISYCTGALGSSVGALLALGADLEQIHGWVDLAAKSRKVAVALAETLGDSHE